MTKESSKTLAKEHENILKVVEALNKECDKIEQGKEINEEFFKKVIDFIRNYADKFHHMKEEDILFKEFNRYGEENPGCLHCNPVEQMLVEHNEGRRLVKGMEESLDKGDKKGLIENSLSYVNLIKEHIFKEENILYPMIDGVLNEEIEKEMLIEFKKISQKNKDKEMKSLEMIEKLKNE